LPIGFEGFAPRLQSSLATVTETWREGKRDERGEELENSLCFTLSVNGSERSGAVPGLYPEFGFESTVQISDATIRDSFWAEIELLFLVARSENAVGSSEELHRMFEEHLRDGKITAQETDAKIISSVSRLNHMKSL